MANNTVDTSSLSIASSLEAPLGLTFVSMWLGFGIGFARDWQRPQILSAELRRASAFKAGGSLGAKLGSFVFVYCGTCLAVRCVRGVPPEAPADVPSSVVGGGMAGLTFGAAAGPYAATMGLLRGAALGFSFGAAQDLTASAIASLEAQAGGETGAESSEPGHAAVARRGGDGGGGGVEDVADVAEAAAELTPTEAAAALAAHLEELAQRMSQPPSSSQPPSPAPVMTAVPPARHD